LSDPVSQIAFRPEPEAASSVPKGHQRRTFQTYPEMLLSVNVDIADIRGESRLLTPNPFGPSLSEISLSNQADPATLDFSN
jgi:hypothetical protein